MAVRDSMHEVGGVVLEKLLAADDGYRGHRIDCGKGHLATFVDYRSKTLQTVLSKLEIRRAYYHCEDCQQGRIPRDRELDVVATSFSPGVRRLMGRVGSKEPFDEGRQDLETLAGIVVKTKEVERVSEKLGEQVEAISRKERQLVFSGKIVRIKPVPKMYIAIDGTGVPMVPRETQGRQGKDDSGGAKTREVKLGCVFTQTSVDDEGFPVRDRDSTTYVGAIETAEEFGQRIFTEAIRRGLRFAERVIVIGDGAPWIWNLASEHFPGATEIVDLYHAREHVSNLAKMLYDAPHARARTQPYIDQLDAGDLEGLLSTFASLRPRSEIVKDEIRKATAYFQINMERMRYQAFRDEAFFVGSGVVEAGCKTVIAHRLKQSGMRWTVRGANAIIALRCCELSGRWEQFWEARCA
jgi:hypothetical protein